MRLFQRHLVKVQTGGKVYYGCLRPLSGQLQTELYGTALQDMQRLLLPRGALVKAGDRLETDAGPYLCLTVRFLPGHVQADIRRCIA